MATKTIVVSDMSGKDVNDEDAVQIRVLSYPGLSQAVRLDAAQAEVDRLKIEAKPLASLEIVNSDGSTETVAVDAELFAKAIKGDVDEVLAMAEGIRIPPSHQEPEATRQRRARGTAPKTEKVDYTSIEHAGSVKRGIVSDGEKQTVREHFDEVNRNLETKGMRQLDLSDISIVEKYGLQDLAKERGIKPEAKS